jgi:hypothetical protein
VGVIEETEISIDTKDIMKSEEIINAFVSSNHNIARIDIEQTNRNRRSIYTGLKNYLKDHKLYDLTVHQKDGEIYIRKK